MEITTHITIPHYVYEFYAKIAENTTDQTPESVMAHCLFIMAGNTASDTLEKLYSDRNSQFSS